MTKRFEVYKCELCGNIVEMMHEGAGELVCCGQPMKLMEEKTADMATEKHVPVVVFGEDSITVTVGSTIHPMEEKHYIEWIQIIADNTSYKKFLNPGDQPVAEFKVKAKKLTAREYCNVHGLWKNEIN
ncbi:MAG: desulfoferrodoxin [Candidatus Muiribacteriota bacterium]